MVLRHVRVMMNGRNGTDGDRGDAQQCGCDDLKAWWVDLSRTRDVASSRCKQNKRQSSVSQQVREDVDDDG